MTSARSLFDLARAIVRAHEQAALDQITVIPVIVDDLHAARPVLRALCEVLDGRLLDTSAADSHFEVPDLNVPVAATDDPVRREAVKIALTTDAGRHVSLVETSDGYLDAVLQDPDVETDPSPGDRTITAIARAAVHRDLDRHPLVIVTYQSGVLDLQYKRAAWSLMVDHFGTMPRSGSLRTLVVVVEAAIDVDLHCLAGRGFRFAIQGERLLQRQGIDSLRAAVRQIARHDSPIVLFLGAGFGASSRMPLGDAMRDGAIQRLIDLPDDHSLSSRDLAMRFHAWLADKPEWLSPTEQAMSPESFAKTLTLERVIDAERQLYSDIPTLTEFKVHHDQVVETPGAAVLSLTEVLQNAHGRIIVAEVNFDLLIEKHARTGIKVFASRNDFSQAGNYIRRYLQGDVIDIPLLKFHGTIEDFSTCIVTQEQTERGVGTEKLGALRALLGDEDSPRLWIYVGMSMRDRDLVRVLHGEDFGRGIDERWVLPYVVDSVEEYAEARAGFWSETNLPRMQDRMITETSDAFFAALAEAWAAP